MILKCSGYNPNLTYKEQGKCVTLGDKGKVKRNSSQIDQTEFIKFQWKKHKVICDTEDILKEIIQCLQR